MSGRAKQDGSGQMVRSFAQLNQVGALNAFKTNQKSARRRATVSLSAGEAMLAAGKLNLRASLDWRFSLTNSNR